MNEITSAGSALSNIAKQGVSGGNKSGDNSFGNLVKNSLEGAIDAQYASEKATAAAITGEGDVLSVLEAVTEAEGTLNTVLAIRDRLTSAYQEIMRQPI